MIQEDADGLIEFSVADMLERAKRKRLLEKSGAKVKLGMMRHLYIILDLSDAMKHPVRIRVRKNVYMRLRFLAQLLKIELLVSDHNTVLLRMTSSELAFYNKR